MDNPKIAKVFMPTGKLEDYLPYFNYEKSPDPEIPEYSYLLRNARLKPDSCLVTDAANDIEAMYNNGDSVWQQYFELEGLKFEYVLLPDQHNVYKLITDDKAKEYLSKVVLNITECEGELIEMVLALPSGVVYGHVSYLDELCDEDKKFVEDLMKKKLLKKKVVKVNSFNPEDD